MGAREVGQITRWLQSAGEDASMHAKLFGAFVGVRVQVKLEPVSSLLVFKTIHGFVAKTIELCFLLQTIHGFVAKTIELCFFVRG